MLILICIVLIPCKNKDFNYCSEIPNLENATMLSLDNRECFCCGGYFIEIKENTFRFSYVEAEHLLGLYNKRLSKKCKS